MTSVNASDEKWESTVEAPTRHRKPLAFDVEDAGCQANGPAMFGGTDTNPTYTMEHAWLQIQNQIKQAYDTGYAKGFRAAQVHYMKVVEEFMVTHLKPTFIVANEPAHLAEDFMTNPKRATEKPRGEGRTTLGQTLTSGMANGTRTIQGWGVDVDKCQHWFVSIKETYGNVPLLQCSKCGYRKADL